MIVTATAPERWEFLPLGPRTRARLEADLVRLNHATRAVAAAHGAEVLDVAGHPGPVAGRRTSRATDSIRRRSATAAPPRASARWSPTASRSRSERSHSDDDHRAQPRQRACAAAPGRSPSPTWSRSRRSPATGTRSTSTPSGRPTSRFGERIAHGMLVLSYSIGLIGFDPDRVVALRGIDSLTFKRPVADRRDDPRRGRGRGRQPDRRRTTSWSSSAGGSSRRRARWPSARSVTIVHRARASASGNGQRAPRAAQRATSDELYGERVLL